MSIQQDLLNKFQTYLAATGGATEYSFKSGLCSGLVTFWLSCIANHRRELYDNYINYILEANIEANKTDPRMEEIIGALMITQNNMFYLENEPQSNMSTSVSLIKPNEDFIELKENASLINSYTVNEIILLLDSLPNNALLRVSSINHTIGINKNNGQLIILDPNSNIYGEEFTEVTTAANKLFKSFKQIPAQTLDLYITFSSKNNQDIIYDIPEQLSSKIIVEKNQALLLAIAAGDSKLALDLVNAGADVNNNTYPIYTALCMYQFNIVQMLFEHGAQINIRMPNNAALIQATIMQNKLGYYNGTPINLGFLNLSLLLENGADPNFANSQKLTPASFAIHKGQLQKLALLIAYGAQLEPHNIWQLRQTYAASTKIWQLCHDIKQFKQCLGKKPVVDRELLQICQDNAHLEQNTDLEDAWHLYELIQPQNDWLCKNNQIYTELASMFTAVQRTVLASRDIAANPKSAATILHILNAVEHFTHIHRTSISKFKLRRSASLAMKNMLIYLVTDLGLESTSQVKDRLQAITAQHTAIIKQQQLLFLSGMDIDLSTHPAASAIIDLAYELKIN